MSTLSYHHSFAQTALSCLQSSVYTGERLIPAVSRPASNIKANQNHPVNSVVQSFIDTNSNTDTDTNTEQKLSYKTSNDPASQFTDYQPIASDSQSQSQAKQNDKHRAAANKPRLHIVLVTETWAPDVNGVAMSLLQLMQQLSAMGHRISLIRPQQLPKLTTHSSIEKSMSAAAAKSDPQQCISYLLEVKGLPIPRYPQLQFGVPAYARIKRCLQDWRPDVVHIATEGPLGLASLLAAKRLHIAATTGYHTQFHDFSRHFGMGIVAAPLMLYFKYFHNGSQATCVPSGKTKADLQSLGFKRLVEVGRGVDIARFNPDKRSEALRSSWGAGQQHTVLMMVSRLSPEKGIDVVIKAYQALQMQQLHRAIKLVIVGDGPDKARLQGMVTDSDDIIFTGAKTGDDLAEHYASGDVFVFASQVETFGNVVTEAMASGLPVYAFNDAAAAMLVDEQCGGLVALKDIDGFINMVANLPKTQQLRRAGQHAREKVLGMSWQRPAQQMQAMFYQVTERKVTDLATPSVWYG